VIIDTTLGVFSGGGFRLFWEVASELQTDLTKTSS